ncbi:MAG: TonB-dependent receptor [Crocinitomicaceae bacterium]|nr:TonB-dependent receptor [Crocinitomicaceae bacterium]
MKKLTLLAFICSCMVTTGYTQITQTIRGKVMDRYSEELIPDAKVFLFGINDSLRRKSDVDGSFRFENVPVGRYTLVATYTSYEEVVMSNLELTSSKELVLNLKMTEKVQVIGEVKVAARGKGETVNRLATVSARTFSIEESQRYAGSLNDVARMAQNFAGVQGADDSRNDIIVRGNSPSGVLYRMEGIDIPNPNHFARFGTTGGPISILNNNVLANSDFFTGAFPAEYGNALASVFDLRMRSGNNEKFEFMGQIGFNGVEGMAEGPISRKKKSSFLVNYRYSTLELFQLIGLEFGTSALPKYQDISFKLNFPTKNGLTQVFGLGGLSNINILSSNVEDQNDIWGNAGNDIYFTSNTGMVGLTHKHRINSNSFFEVLLGMQGAYNNARNDSLDFNGLNPFTTFNSEATNGKQTIVVNYQNKLSSRHLIKAGIINDVYLLSLNDSVYVPSAVAFASLRDFEGATSLIRSHFQHRYRLNENLTLVSGVYSQFLTLGKQWSVEPRIGLNVQLNKNQSINAGYGLHSQMAPIELYFAQIQNLDGSYTTPNTELGFTNSHHLIAGYEKRFKHGIKLKAEVYGQYLTNVPIEQKSSAYSLLNFGATFNTSIPDSIHNGGEGRNYGIELTLEKFLDKGFYFLVTASLFESKYKGSDDVWRNTAFNGNHTLNTLIGYEFRFGKKSKEEKKYYSALSIDFKFTWNGGGRYTEILIPESIAANKEVRDVSNAFAKKYQDYLKGNFRIAYKLIGRNTTQEWALDLQNFTDRDNIFYQQYNPYAGQVRTIYQNGFIPVFQYRITF